MPALVEPVTVASNVGFPDKRRRVIQNFKVEIPGPRQVLFGCFDVCRV